MNLSNIKDLRSQRPRQTWAVSCLPTGPGPGALSSELQFVALKWARWSPAPRWQAWPSPPSPGPDLGQGWGAASTWLLRPGGLGPFSGLSNSTPLEGCREGPTPCPEDGGRPGEVGSVGFHPPVWQPGGRDRVRGQTEWRRAGTVVRGHGAERSPREGGGSLLDEAVQTLLKDLEVERNGSPELRLEERGAQGVPPRNTAPHPRCCTTPRGTVQRLSLIHI